MIEYDIAAVAARKSRRAPGSRVILPPLVDRIGTRQDYYVILRKLLAALRNEVITSIIPVYQYEQAQRKALRRSMRDADESTFSRLRQLAAELDRQMINMVERVLNLEAQRHTDTFLGTARAALGVDLTSVVTQEDLRDYLAQAAARNASLIKSLSAETVKRVEQAVLQAGIRGDGVQALKSVLTGEFGVMNRRAQLIARDQTAKLNSDLNRIRQQQAGIDNYTWSTVHDERVRPLHAAIDGKEYEWGKPTGAEDGLPPGQPIQCRCVARGIVEFGAPAAKPVAPSVPSREEMDAKAKKYVVEEGKRTNTEYLQAFDVDTGETFTNTSGKRGSVAFTEELIKAFSDPKRTIIAHHNHPSSRSFSLQDMLELSRPNNGLKGLWAHGHNGSSYYAEWGGADKTYKSIESFETYVRNHYQALVYPGKTLDAEEAGIIHAHTVALLADRKGVIRYKYDLRSITKKIVAKHQALIEKVINDY